ncbi:hypothetical protein ACSBR2_028678 [Camellia fascicularis]
MGTNSPPPPPPPPPQPPVQVQEVPRPSSEPTTLKPDSSPTNPTTPIPTPTIIPTIASNDSKETPVTITSKQQEPPSSDADFIYIPGYSRWFSWNNIHECEARFLPEFFDGRSPSKNPRVYKYYRNSIVRRFRENPTRKITFTEARKTIIGDVGSVRRVFDFLEAWGLINYSPPATSKLPLKWEDKESKSITASLQSTAEPAGNAADYMVPKKRLCSGCKSVCSIACFASDKYDLTLCARCYVRGNYRVGVSSSDFRRVEINEEIKTDWTDKETLQLLEAVMHFGDDWKKVAEYVGGRSERECVTCFIKLPFAEQFVEDPEFTKADNKFCQTNGQNDTEIGSQSFGTAFPNKKMRLSPLADASNPIMAQAAFLSALGGVEVAETAARAAVRALSEFRYRTFKDSPESLSGHGRQQEPDATSNGDTTLKTSEGAHVDAQSHVEKEEQDLEKAISRIADVQMKEIQDKISYFEEFELQMDREWQQLQQMKNLLFVDQLTLHFHQSAAPKIAESIQQNVKTE